MRGQKHLQAPEFTSSNLTCAGLRQFPHEFDLAGMFIGSKFAAHKVLKFFLHVVRRLMRAVKPHKSFRHHPMQLIGRRNNRGLQPTWMLKEHSLDLGRCDVDTAADNNVIISALIAEEAVTVAHVYITRNIPSS